jgi:hypothetical protein
VMVGFAFIVERMSVTPRPVLWGGVSQHYRTELFVNAGNLNAVQDLMQLVATLLILTPPLFRDTLFHFC